MPVSPEIALAGCFFSSAAFAAALTTRWGQEKTLDHLWIAGFVVAGVLVVLGWYYTANPVGALWAFAYFVAGGTPMGIRAIGLKIHQKQQHIAYLRSRAEKAEQARKDDDTE